MDQLPVLSSGFRSILVNLLKEDYFSSGKESSISNHAHLQEKYNALLTNINGFFIICNYTTGLYEYISTNIKDYLGYELKGYSPLELTHFVASIIDEKHIDANCI